MGSSLRVAVLQWSDILAEYALFMLMSYLRDVWKLEFRPAAAIINAFWGTAAIMPIAMKFITMKLKNQKDQNLEDQTLDAEKRKAQKIDRWMVLLSSMAYTVGLGLMSLSTPELVSETIGVRQETLFYTALPLIAIARSGFAVSLDKVLIAEKGGVSNQVIDLSVTIAAKALANLVGLAIFYVFKKWLRRFGIPALCMTVATVIFSTVICIPSFDKANIQATLLTTVYNEVHKLVISVFKECVLRPLQWFCCCCFWCWENVCTRPQSEQQNDTEGSGKENDTTVEETRFIISLFPICLLGLVSSLGNTFFLEQAYSMDRKIIGSLTVPLPILLACYNLARFVFPKLYFDIIDSWIPSGCKRLKRLFNRIGMALSLLYALLCCVLAAVVERRRIHRVNNDPMSILYLFPQFFLLGGFYGMAYESVGRFFKDCEIPKTMKPYMVDSAVGVFGLGNIGSILLVYLVHNITSSEGSPSWFEKTIDSSRLDKYYWLLSVWTAANLVWYMLVALQYPPKNKSSTSTDEEPGCSLISLAKKYCFFLKCLPEKFPDCCCCCCCCCCCSADPNAETLVAGRLAHG